MSGTGTWSAGRGQVAVAGALLLAAIFFAPVPIASGDVSIGTRGTDAGQVRNGESIAVDTAAELLYVADRFNNRIDVFDAGTGEFVRAFGWGVLDGNAEPQVCTTASGCQEGIRGTEPGQFFEPKFIAVDVAPASAAFHDVYVVDRSSSVRRVQRYTPAGAFVTEFGSAGSGEGEFQTIAGLAVNTSGVVTVVDYSFAGPCGGPGPGSTEYTTRVQRFTSEGVVSGTEVPLSGNPCSNPVELALDSEDNIYLAGGDAAGAVTKYQPDGTVFGAPYPLDHSFNITAVAIGPSDELFVADNTNVPASIIEYSATGSQQRTFYGSLITRAESIAAFESSSGDVFAAENPPFESSESGVRHIAFPPPGPVVHPAPETSFASNVGNVKATLNTRVNSEGKATKYQFEYITDADYKAAGESFGAGTVTTPEEDVPPPVDFATVETCKEENIEKAGSEKVACELHSVEAEITELIPETVYHFRAVATNADGGPNPGPDVTFETKEPIEIGDAWSTAVGTDSASLHAEVNPLGIAATGRFQYVDLETFEESGFAEAAEAPAAGLEPIDFGEGEDFADGQAQIYPLEPGTTYRYRLVATDRCEPEPAPLCDFFGPEAELTTFLPSTVPGGSCPNQQFRAGPAAFLPDCRGYEMVSPVDKNGSNVESLANVTSLSAALDQAAEDGESISYTTYKAFGDVVSAPYVNQYISRRDIGGWSTEPISPPREGPSLMTYQSAQLDLQYKAFSVDLCRAWVVQDANPVLAPGGVEGFPGLYRRENCGAEVGSYSSLTTVEPPNLPPKRFIPELQGTSTDGSVAVFMVGDNLASGTPAQPVACQEDLSPGSETCEYRLYEARGGSLAFVCILPGGTPVEGSCRAGTMPSAGAPNRSGSVQHAISDNGSRIFWTDGNNEAGPLYVRVDGSETIEISAAAAVFRAASADGAKVLYSVGDDLYEFDVDAETETQIAGELIGVAGASDNLSQIYLASKEVLAAGASEGERNLYLREVGVGTRYIGTLVSADQTNGISPLAIAPLRRVSRVTADGSQIVFMSYGSLTGYDNTDATTKEPVMEVFLYDATADGGAGMLRCVSCNPSGARPQGQKPTGVGFLSLRAAAQIPAWESQLYGQRMISSDGRRVYFNSFEALVSRDTNGQQDVYQWEAAGSGDCTTSSPTYGEAAEGCVDLISSGESPSKSELVDVSSDGGDVFIRTASSLVEQDDGLLDIYDVRVGGGFPVPPQPPQPCEGESCQNPAPAPEDSTPSSTVVGPGNPAPRTIRPRKCAKGKHKVKRKGKVRCVRKKHKRKHARHDRRHRSPRATR